jgi:molybdopterin/thiamine biosynthesis adenylyltransferase
LCCRSLYPDLGDGGESCAREGVLAPLVGNIDSMQATDAVKTSSALVHACSAGSSCWMH